MKGGPGAGDPDRIAYTNIMLRPILSIAYGVKSYQISGPDWIETLRFDISAKVPGGATKEQFQAMVAKNGPKIHPAVEDGAAPDELQLATVQRSEGKDGFPVVGMRAPGPIIETKDGRARITAKAVPITKFAGMLAVRVGRPVFDTTGLAANYRKVSTRQAEAG